MDKQNLTEEQLQKIEKINQAFQKTCEAIDERRAYRMKNYYDCIDDYSWGGPCDKADNDAENRARITRDIRIQEVIGNGRHTLHSTFYQLVDEKGNKARGANYGRYGFYFAFADKCVGVPKRVQTLTKKGYRLELVERTFSCVFKGFSRNGYLLYSDMQLLDEKTTVVENEMPEYIAEFPFADVQYEENFANKRNNK